MPHYNIGLTIDLDRWHDTRRGVEPAWRSWCKSPTWKSIRRHRLAEEPRCRQCAIEGRIVAASHVDHIEPHLGQWLLFSNTRTLKASALTTTIGLIIRRSAATPPTSQRTSWWGGADGRADFLENPFALVTWRADVRSFGGAA